MECLCIQMRAISKDHFMPTPFPALVKHFKEITVLLVSYNTATVASLDLPAMEQVYQLLSLFVFVISVLVTCDFRKVSKFLYIVRLVLYQFLFSLRRLGRQTVGLVQSWVAFTLERFWGNESELTFYLWKYYHLGCSFTLVEQKHAMKTATSNSVTIACTSKTIPLCRQHLCPGSVFC